MPICTYLSATQYRNDISDSHLQELLNDVRDATKNDWRIGVVVDSTTGFFRKKHVRYYSLYNHVNGGEFQIINFYIPDCESCSTVVSAEVIAAYLLGVMSSHESATKAAGKG